MTRTEASRALAKVLAYLGCGKTAAAGVAAAPLVRWLQTVQRDGAAVFTRDDCRCGPDCQRWLPCDCHCHEAAL